MKFRLSTKVVAIVLMSVLVLMLIPTFAVGRCAVPQVDDFRNGRPMHDALLASGDAGAMLSAAIEDTNNVYETWQGTYGAVLLMTLQPFMFGMEYYFVSVCFLLVSLLLCVFYLVWTVGKHILKCSASERWILYALIMLPCTQMLVSPLEAFYYYVGGVFYTFYFCLSALLLGLIVAFWYRQKGKRRNAAYYVLIPLLCVLLAGGNYTTGLIMALLLCAAVLTDVFVLRRRNALLPVGCLLFLALFCLSLFAPGNMARQHLSTGASNVLVAGVRSVVKGLRCGVVWTTPLMLLLLIAAIPMAWRFAGKTAYAFRFPLLVPAALVLLLGAGFMSTYYTQGYPGGDRLLNIQYDMYVLGAFCTLFYLTGWCRRRLEAMQPGLPERVSAWFDKSRARILVGFAALLALCAGANYDTLTGARAAVSLLSGEATGFRQEMLSRFEALETSEEPLVAVDPLENKPALLLLTEYSTDPAHWENVWVSEYFHKEGVFVGSDGAS